MFALAWSPRPRSGRAVQLRKESTEVPSCIRQEAFEEGPWFATAMERVLGFSGMDAPLMERALSEGLEVERWCVKKLDST